MTWALDLALNICITFAYLKDFGKYPSQNDVFVSVVRGLHISFCISLTSFTSSELRLNEKAREEMFVACSQYEIEKK